MDQQIEAARPGPLQADAEWQAAAGSIVAAGRRLDRYGWVPATAGNLSVRLPDGRIAITRSGGHKGFLSQSAVIEVDLDGTPRREGDTPSAETLLHCQIYRTLLPHGAVLHGHSVAATVLSMRGHRSAIEFSGYELLKAFEGRTTHDVTLALPIFDNDQDIRRLSAAIEPRLGDCPLGYLIRGHGVYVWGHTMELALARLEGLEFLLACALEQAKLDMRA